MYVKFLFSFYYIPCIDIRVTCLKIFVKSLDCVAAKMMNVMGCALINQGRGSHGGRTGFKE